MSAHPRFVQLYGAVRCMGWVCALATVACLSAPRNGPGTVDPGISPPNAEEVGQSATQSVGARGGTVGTPSQSAFAAVPSGALKSNVDLSVKVASAQGMPLEANLLTNVYDFGPSQTTFAKPVILSVAVATPPSSNQQAMMAYLDANQVWQALLDSSYNPGTGVVTATTTHFTPFTIISFGTDGGGCATQNDPDAFCDKWQLTCDLFSNVCGTRTFTIGGEVRGLHGSLTLRDNLGDALVVVVDSLFTFPSAYHAGDGYVVTVGQSPANQNCTLAHASGMVNQADVNDILVTCVDNTPQTFALGGKIIGLANGQHVTLTQGSQSVVVGANGDFVFPQELAWQAPYSIGVAQQPDGQVCAAVNPNGVVQGLDLNILVICENALPTFSEVGGTVLGLLPGKMLVLTNLSDTNDIIAVAGNGNFIVSTHIGVGSDFNVVVSAQPAGQHCRVDGGTGQAGTDTSWGITVSCATPGALQFTLGQPANVVIGAPDFTSRNVGAAVAGNVVLTPQGSAYGAPNGALYVGDTGSFRALLFAQVPLQNGVSADAVLGQVRADASISITGPQAVASSGHFAGIGGDGNALLLTDPIDNRVLVYTHLPVSDANAQWVLGQTGLANRANLPACSRAGFNGPMGVAFAHNQGVVADTLNHRVMIYSGLPTGSSVLASLVLGQPDFNTCTPPVAASATTLDAPQGVWTDGNRLLVADTGANRVLFWRVFPTAMHQPADAVIGQADLLGHDVVLGSAGTMQPTGVASDGHAIWTSSLGFNRVEQWPFPTPGMPGPNAVGVLGQANFDDTSRNACDCATPSAAGLYAPGGVSVVGTTLVVTDTGNNRYLIYASE